jgi:Dirigent-like protein
LKIILNFEEFNDMRRTGRYEGSISIIGGTNNIKPSEYPVVGGTGDFMYALGHIRSSPVDLTGLTVVYRIDFFLYWPPYAATAPK